MSPQVLLLGLCGAGFGAGVMMIAAAFRPGDRAEAFSFRKVRAATLWKTAALRRTQLARCAIAAVLAAVIWLLSGWPVAGLATAALVVGLPWLFGAGKLAEHRIARLQALEEWTRRLADLMIGGSLRLTGAIQASRDTAPPAIADEVVTLAQRLKRWDFDDAVLAFADSLNDAVGDAVAAGLITAHRQGSGVTSVPTPLRVNSSSSRLSSRWPEIRCVRPTPCSQARTAAGR